MHRHDTITFDEKLVTVQVDLFAQITKEGGGYVVVCPSLDICSQGDTLAEAKKNIREAVDLFLEVCIENGRLSEALRKRGFQKVEDINKAERRRLERHKSLAKPASRRVIIPVALPLAA